MENSATLASTPWSHGLSSPNPPHPSGTNDVTKVTWQTEKKEQWGNSSPLLGGRDTMDTHWKSDIDNKITLSEIPSFRPSMNNDDFCATQFCFLQQMLQYYYTRTLFLRYYSIHCFAIPPLGVREGTCHLPERFLAVFIYNCAHEGRGQEVRWSVKVTASDIIDIFSLCDKFLLFCTRRIFWFAEEFQSSHREGRPFLPPSATSKDST
ncbi:hypothetical protein CDAR_395221 [Caerostris darwini]|uniref:Uncharacterized protein n=1 Tax=Caerostris darwini TaxID=1538125 RepID=A0AAV4QEC9_9ARAC|nr:hypothetical protein CDAR_395221 [Caerostris darwini]